MAFQGLQATEQSERKERPVAWGQESEKSQCLGGWRDRGKGK